MSSDEQKPVDNVEEKAEEAVGEGTVEVLKKDTADSVQLAGLFAFKQGMSSIYNDKGDAVPVTVLKYEPWYVSQIKTNDKDGYEAVQIACTPKSAKNSTKAQTAHLSKTIFENGVRFLREIRGPLPEGISIGQKIELESLAKGDHVKVTGLSKGRGYAGVMKRYGFGGGPAAHGSGFHRAPGSIGNRTWPGRVVPGKKLPGQYGNKQKTLTRLQIVDVIPEESVLLVKGSVPGAQNTMLKLLKV